MMMLALFDDGQGVLYVDVLLSRAAWLCGGYHKHHHILFKSVSNKLQDLEAKKEKIFHTRSL